jgi:MFS family permease
MNAEIKNRPSLPPGLRNAYHFSIFNALSYQIVLGSPMILYAKYLEASATVLGIVAGMMPLLVILQIPAASHISRIGYKNFVFAGWGIRVLFIFLMSLVPVTAPFLGPTSQMGLMLFLLFGFNLSRGISSAAWLPWITALVPAAVRGNFLARDAAFVNAGSFLTLVLTGLLLGTNPSPWQFTAAFAFSALSGSVSLFFLRRIPDVAPPDREGGGPEPVPWKEIAAYPPFRKLLRFNVAWSLAFGGLNVFTVAWLKSAAGFHDGTILIVTAVSYLGGLGGLALFGTRLDRYGSKPVLTVCILGWLGILVGWTLLSGKVLPYRLELVLGLGICMGLGFAVYTMANNRLAMAIVPEMGRNHFFALFSVVSNLVLGIGPILWGLQIDIWGTRETVFLGINWNRYSGYFLAMILLFGATLWLCRSLEEPKARNVEELIQDFLAKTPFRSWMRFWPRG